MVIAYVVLAFDYIYSYTMQAQTEVIKYDVVIVGAGPAGATCALALKDAGLSVALLDKSSFPRDKVCWDAIPGRAIKTLNSVSPEFGIAFRKFSEKYLTRRTTLFYKGNELTFDWVLEAYTCTRMEFDNFLFTFVKENTATDIFTNAQPETITQFNNHISVSLKDSNKILGAKIVIGADGAQSVIAKQLTNKTIDRKHYVGSLRAYFSNVGNIKNDTIEVYFDKRFLPSYLWVFPVPGNMANVGFGMLSSEITKRKINIKKAFYDFLEQIPELKQKFSGAMQVGGLEGFGLPLGSNISTISGANFMLTGDAASLIDPVSGDGIGNAVLSGKLAAEQVARCFNQNNFSASFMRAYDTSLLAAIGDELKTNYRAQRILSAMPFLLDVLFLAGKNKTLKKLIQKGL